MSAKPKAKSVTRRQKVFSVISWNQCRLLVRAEKSDDDRLCGLVKGTGYLADCVILKNDPRDLLQRLAAYALGWAELLTAGDVLALIHAERDRQEMFLKTGKFTFTCASAVADSRRKLRVLVEEVGEVAEAIDILELTKAGRKAAIKHLRDELTQVAAVAVAWLESMEDK